MNNRSLAESTEALIKELAYSLKRVRAFKVSYLQETNTRSCRVKIEDLYYNSEFSKGKKSVIIPFPAHNHYDSIETALHYLIKAGFEINSISNNKDYSLIMVDSFSQELK